jgi:hypothetical protein
MEPPLYDRIEEGYPATWRTDPRLAASIWEALGDAKSVVNAAAAGASGFEEDALAVADQGLTTGDSPTRARRAARLLQASELLFWDTLADAL